jgi:alpha-L-rhamnosidase
MKKIFLVSAFFFFMNGIGWGQLLVGNLRCENRINPLGIDIPNPRFSWQLASERRNIIQTAYEIRVTDQSGNTYFWKSGKQSGNQSIYVPYAGITLKPATFYYWQVRVWDNQGEVTEWSQKSFWQMGLLNPGDWKAHWIETESPADTVNGPALLFRKSFVASKKIKSAVAFVTVHGMYEASINGKKMGDAFLTPGWTSYNKRLQYQVYDVTQNLLEGRNVIGVQIGSGWYRTNLAWDNNRNIYGKKIALIFQLDISYTDGSHETIVSDSSWKSSDGGPIRSSEIYNGEVYDAKKEINGWNLPGFSDQEWHGTKEKDFSKKILIGTYNEAVRAHEGFKALRIFKTPNGEQVVDFGQNLVGWETIKLSFGKPGDTITVDHAEVLDKNGNFYTDNLRAAKSENKYIIKGGVEEVLVPHFTFHGFRYIRIKGFNGEILIDSLATISSRDPTMQISAKALYSDMEPTGQFSCSNPLLNQLQHNIQWGQKGNFLDVPTDCPQRDERLGWTGDAQAFSRTASFSHGAKKL